MCRQDAHHCERQDRGRVCIAGRARLDLESEWAANEGRFHFMVIEHPACGAGPPLHFHTTFEDSFFVLDGLLTVQLGDDVVELGSGDFATAPPGVPHSLTNAHADQSACRVVNLLTPGIGFDRYISQIDQLTANGH